MANTLFIAQRARACKGNETQSSLQKQSRLTVVQASRLDQQARGVIIAFIALIKHQRKERLFQFPRWLCRHFQRSRASKLGG
jgi:hypothetical protein